MESMKFKLYRSGIHLADIYYKENGISYSHRDIYSNTWSRVKEFKQADNQHLEDYGLDFLEIHESIKSCNELNFSSLNGFQLNKRIYERYSRAEADTCNGYGIIWAERQRKFPLDIVTAGQSVIGFILSKRAECIILVLEGYECFTPLRSWENPLLSKAEFGVKFLGTQKVEMRDGVQLATDVWLPNGGIKESKLPAILVRTPYGKGRTFENYLGFVQRGYGLIVQDTRGREDSQGEFRSQGCERDDGDDTLSWVHRQDWCDGNISMIGGSYLGYVQWAAASSGNPHLKAVVSIVTAGSPFIDLPRKGGTLISGILAWVFAMSERRFCPEAMVRNDWDNIIKIRPIKDIPRKVLGYDIPLWDEIISRSAKDSFWEDWDWSIRGDKINVPALIVSGWFDDNGQGSLEAWNTNKKNNRKDIKMILGPWLHKANTTRDIGGVSFGNNAIRYDMDLTFLQWFDRYLKGVNNGVDGIPAVQYYLQGKDEWRSAEAWTPEVAVQKKLYLDSRGNANSSSGDGKLNWQKTFHEAYDSYIFDPQNPAPFLVDISENELNVPADYKEIEKRRDVLVYTSDVLEEEVTVAGEIYAEIYAMSSAKDTDWVVRLTDVDTEGSSRRLVDGLYRARYINDFTEEKLLSEGEIRKYNINMFHTANTFRKGHRIRIEITSGAENLIFPNHNTGNDSSTDTEYVVAEQKIFHSHQYASHIVLPVLQEENPQ